MSTPSSTESVGRLSVVGTGIKFKAQMTAECEAHIRGADVVWYAVTDALTADLLHSINQNSRSLSPYVNGVPSLKTYESWIETLLADVVKGNWVSAVFYGHPGFFVYAGRQAVQMARSLGYHADLLPGVSSLACMFADLELEPARSGLMCFEAHDFIRRDRIIDHTVPLVLFQPANIDGGHVDNTRPGPARGILVDRLREIYGEQQKVTLYRGAILPTSIPMVKQISLDQLRIAEIDHATSLVVLPINEAPFHPVQAQNRATQDY